MLDLQEQMVRWLCLIYNARGNLAEEAWKEFARWCEANDLTREIAPPGRMLRFVQQDGTYDTAAAIRFLTTGELP